MGDHIGVTEMQLVPDNLAAVAARIPTYWLMSYTAAGALQNIAFFERGIAHLTLDAQVRVFMSVGTAAIVCGLVELAAVRDPHVREWFSSFREVPLAEAMGRLTRYPEWPYNGMTIEQARGLMTSFADQHSRSVRMLRRRGLAMIGSDGRDVSSPAETSPPQR